VHMPRARRAWCPTSGRRLAVTPYDDDNDEDWVGTPPEGHYTRDRAKPEFWWRQRPVSYTAVGLAVVIVVLVIIALLR